MYFKSTRNLQKTKKIVLHFAAETEVYQRPNIFRPLIVDFLPMPTSKVFKVSLEG